MKSKNIPDESKSLAIQAAQDHITLVWAEWSYYKTVCSDSAAVLKSRFTDAASSFAIPRAGSCIPGLQHDGTVHYSFDFAQQVHYPSNPQQPGPITFLRQESVGCMESVVREY